MSMMNVLRTNIRFRRNGFIIFHLYHQQQITYHVTQTEKHMLYTGKCAKMWSVLLTLVTNFSHINSLCTVWVYIIYMLLKTIISQ